MKKLLSILLAALLVVACLGMVGCGTEGKYEFYAYEINGTQYKVGDSFMGAEITKEAVADEGFWLDKDGVVKHLDGEVEEGLKWEEKDGQIIFKMGEIETLKATKDGRKLIIDMGGMKLILKK